MLIPHAVQIATKGILGVTIGTVSKGFLIRIEEYVPPIVEDREIPGSSGSWRRKDDAKKDKKCILVTVIAYGKTYKSEHCVNKNARIRIEDVHIVDDGEKIVSVEIRNVR